MYRIQRIRSEPWELNPTRLFWTSGFLQTLNLKRFYRCSQILRDSKHFSLSQDRFKMLNIEVKLLCSVLFLLDGQSLVKTRSIFCKESKYIFSSQYFLNNKTSLSFCSRSGENNSKGHLGWWSWVAGAGVWKVSTYARVSVALDA